MTLKIVDTCPACGSSSFNKDDKCYSCGHDPKRSCASCDYTLDGRGRCARCYGADPQSLEALKWVSITWTMCTVHGAMEAGGKESHYHVSWTTPNAKDKRKKDGHSEWRHRCLACMAVNNAKGSFDWKMAESAITYRDKIMIPREVYQPLIDVKLAAFRGES